MAPCPVIVGAVHGSEAAGTREAWKRQSLGEPAASAEEMSVITSGERITRRAAGLRQPFRSLTKSLRSEILFGLEVGGGSGHRDSDARLVRRCSPGIRS